jgi:hypothetical protein
MLTNQDFQRELESSPVRPLKYRDIVSFDQRTVLKFTDKMVGVES